MLGLTVQEQVANRAYSLSDEDAKMFLTLMDRVMESYPLPILTPEDRAIFEIFNLSGNGEIFYIKTGSEGKCLHSRMKRHIILTIRL